MVANDQNNQDENAYKINIVCTWTTFRLRETLYNVKFLSCTIRFKKHVLALSPAIH